VSDVRSACPPAGAECRKPDIVASDIDALRLEWRNLFRNRALKALPKCLLVKALAYQFQAMALDAHRWGKYHYYISPRELRSTRVDTMPIVRLSAP
jgi:hypothetical protein